MITDDMKSRPEDECRACWLEAAAQALLLLDRIGALSPEMKARIGQMAAVDMVDSA